jgi:hypothetical protein
MVDSGSPIWVAPAIGIAGVGLGWILNQVSNRFTRRADRARDVAAEWRDALVQVWLTIAPRSAQRVELQLASGDWARAWMAYSGAVPKQVACRVEPLHHLLWALDISAEGLKEGLDRSSPYYAIVAHDGETFFLAADLVERAFGDALAALDAFILGRHLPPRGFLSASEMTAILAQHGTEVEDRLLHELSAAASALPMPERTRLNLSVNLRSGA